jgi:hypothetical protein
MRCAATRPKGQQLLYGQQRLAHHLAHLLDLQQRRR